MRALMEISTVITMGCKGIFGPKLEDIPVTLSVDTSLCPYGIAHRRVYQPSGLFQKPLRCPRCGGRRWSEEKEFFTDDLLVQIHFIIEIVWWIGLAPWEFEFPFPGSLVSTFLHSEPQIPNTKP